MNFEIGKSNLMDAISFVLGVKAAHLRGTNLKDLVYNVEGKAGKKPRGASVTLVFVTQSGKEILFRRSITPEGRIFFIFSFIDSFQGQLHTTG